jgi:hypothetical protein
MFGNDEENRNDMLYLVMARLGHDMAQLDPAKRPSVRDAEARLDTIRTRFCDLKLS